MHNSGIQGSAQASHHDIIRTAAGRGALSSAQAGSAAVGKSAYSSPSSSVWVGRGRGREIVLAALHALVSELG
eukprot:scaffold7113_cov396-Pinguiococcus_pyrenoidosus.AAC.1